MANDKKKRREDEAVAKANYVGSTSNVRVKAEPEKRVVRNYGIKPLHQRLNEKRAVSRTMGKTYRDDRAAFVKDAMSSGIEGALQNQQKRQDQRTLDMAIDGIRSGKITPADVGMSMKEAPEITAPGYGYRRAGNTTVYATPYNPLPDPKHTKTATRAQAPGAFGIAPDEYMSGMKAFRDFDAFGQKEKPKAATHNTLENEGAKNFIDKWFPEKQGQLPTQDEMFEKWAQLEPWQQGMYELDQQTYGSVIEDHRALADDDMRLYEEEREKTQAARDAAIELLGEDAPAYAYETKADMYGRFANTYGMSEAAKAYEQEYKMPDVFGDYDEHDATMYMIQHPEHRQSLERYEGTENETGYSIFNREMTDDQKTKYMAIAGVYGEAAAQDWLKNELTEGGYNERAYWTRDEALRAGANEDWLAATGKSILNAPLQLMGTAYGIQQGLKGEEIDPYNNAFRFNQAVQTPRDEVQQMITENFGTKDENGMPKDNFFSWLMKSGYNAGTSGGDSLMAMPFNLLLPGGGALMQGAWGASGQIQDATMRGAGTAEALLAGGISAAIETATEYLPMDNLIKTLDSKDIRSFKDIIVNAAKGGFLDAPGEGLSELLGYISDDIIMGEMSNWDALVAEKGTAGAAKQVAWDVFNGAFVGWLSGSGTTTLAGTGAAVKNAWNGRGADASIQQEAPVQQPEPVQQPVQQEQQQVEEDPWDVPDEPITEEQQAEEQQPAETPVNVEGSNPLRAEREVTGRRPENTAATSEAAQQTAQETKTEEQQAEEQKPVETPVKAENGNTLRAEREVTGRRTESTAAASEVAQQTAPENKAEEQQVEEQKPAETPVKAGTGNPLRAEREVTVRRGNAEQQMTVTGVETVSNGHVLLDVRNEDGDIEVVDAADADFGDAAMNELATSPQIAKMDGKTASVFLEGYDANIATPQEYAQAFASAYEDGRAGLEYERMMQYDQQAMKHLTSGARQMAYTRGAAALIQKHGDKYRKGGVVKSYSGAAWRQMTGAQKRRARANMELANVIGKRMGRQIEVVDEIVVDGEKANAMYDRRTGTIKVALDADAQAYAYVAMHELTHALKNEHAEEYYALENFVAEALDRKGQSLADLMDEQIERYGLKPEEALEEVICNTVPALLRDEQNVMELYKGNRTLFERVMDWVRTLLDDVNATGDMLSKGSADWAQMDVLKDSREDLQKMLEIMEAAFDKEGNEKGHSGDEGGMAGSEIRYSLKDTEMMSWREQVNKVLNGNILRSATLSLPKTGVEFSAFGMKSLPVGVNIKDLRKVMRSEKGSRSAHGLSKKTILAFEEEIKKPKVIFENAKTAFAYVITSQKNENGNPVMMVIQENQKDPVGVDMHQLKSAYGMQNPLQYMLDHLPEGSKFYAQNNEALIQAMAGAHFTINEADIQTLEKHFTRIVPQNKQTVNTKLSRKSTTDTDGNELTEAQQTYFADSKVRNENGNLMVMYHGTPNGSYDRFRSGTYFTPERNYADVYQNAGASSISVKKNADAPQTFKVYLDIKKPFDTRDPKIRKIFMDEYYRKWGTGAPLMESGLPDWTDGMDLQEFIEEMGYDFDGLILDEGGVPDDNGGVKSRGLSYVIFDPSQAKTVDNLTPTDDQRMKFSRKGLDPAIDEEIEHTAAAFEQVRHTHRITAAEADQLAGKILKEANSTYDRQELAKELAGIFDYIERAETVDMDHVDDMQTRLMASVMEKSQVLDTEHEELVQPIRDYFKNVSIRLSDEQRSEAANIMGSYAGYRRRLMGRVKLNNTSRLGLEDAWRELADITKNTEWFPEDANAMDLPGMLLDLVDAMKPVYNTPQNMEETASWLAGKLNEAYLKLPAVVAGAKNKTALGTSVKELRKAMTRFAEASSEAFGDVLAQLERARRKNRDESDREAWAEIRRQYDEWKAQDADKREERFQLELKHAKDKLTANDLAMRTVYAKIMAESYKRQRQKDMAEMRERELLKKQRARAEATVKTMMNWIERPTDTKHVPVGLEEPVKDLLTAMDFSGKDTKTAKSLSERLDELATAVEAAQEGEDENRTVFLERDQQMVDELRRLAQLIKGNTEGRGVYDLNGHELKELNKWLGAVKHVITQANKMHGSNLGDVQQVAQETIKELSGKKPMKDKKWITKQWETYFGTDMMDSFTFFERMGKTSTRVFKGLREGFDKSVSLIREAEKHTQKILEGVNLKKLSGKKAEKLTFEIGGEGGRKLEMTRAQMMELYVLNKREQARGHIYGDGIRIKGSEDAHPFALTEQDVEAITSKLTEKEKQIADEMQKFLAERCAEWGNETSVKLLGYEKFGEEHYWPIATDSNARNTLKLDDNFAANISAIKNQGMTKALTENARNTIMIGDIFDTYTQHISNMSAYAAYAVPLSDVQKWFNSRGVKTELEHVMGKKGLAYIRNFLMAVNGTAQQGDTSALGKISKVMARNAKTAAVGGNLRVIVQQPTSYARAGMYMSPKYLTKALNAKTPDPELINKWCPIAQWKRYGFYETNVGPGLREMIVGDMSGIDKMRDAMMKPAAAGDNWTLNHLWSACEMETADLYPELDRKSDEFYQKVGERMSEIIDRTQVVDSPFHRSQIMRSKNWLDQTLTNFMSEPNKTFNMLTSAIYAYTENRKNPVARARVAKAFSVWAVTSVLTAAAAGVVDAFRDDDEEKTWLEKYGSAVLGNTADSMNPLGMLPGVKDVMSLLQGYDPSRLDQQSIQRIVWAMEELQKYSEGKSKQNLYGVTYKVAQAVSSVTGAPLSNAMRDMNALVQGVTGFNPTLSEESRKGSTVSGLYETMLEAGKAETVKEKDAAAKKIEAAREKLKKIGMNPKEIDEAIAGILAEDPRIKDAWEAKQQHRVGDVNRTKNALAHEGFTGEMVDKAIIEYGKSVTPKEEKEKDMDAQLKAKLFTQDEAVAAIRAGASVDDIKYLMSELVSDSKAKDPGESVRKELVSEIKKDYMAAVSKGDRAGENRAKTVLMDALGVKEEEMTAWQREQHTADLKTAMDAFDTKAALKAVGVMRADGKTDSQIKTSLAKYRHTYVEAYERGDMKTANKVKTLLMSLGLKGTNGKPLYDEDTFVYWLK